jgi:hypothetical protein
MRIRPAPAIVRQRRTDAGVRPSRCPVGGVGRPVYAENSVRFDLMTESLNVGRDGRADIPPLEWVRRSSSPGADLKQRMPR